MERFVPSRPDCGERALCPYPTSDQPEMISRLLVHHCSSYIIAPSSLKLDSISTHPLILHYQLPVTPRCSYHTCLRNGARLSRHPTSLTYCTSCPCEDPTSERRYINSVRPPLLPPYTSQPLVSVCSRRISQSHYLLRLRPEASVCIMSSGSNSPPRASPGPTDRRRASITGQTFQDLFGRSGSYSGQQSGRPGMPGPIATAAVNAQQRRLSLTTIGLSASPGQTSPFLTNPRTRTESLSSVNSGSVDESPFEDDYAPSTPAPGSNPATPFARRLSFGARAMRDVRQGSGSVGNPNGRPSTHKPSPPTGGRGRGLSSLSNSLPTVPPFLHSSSPPGRSSRRSISISAVWPQTIAENIEDYSEYERSLTWSSTGEGYNFAENLRSRAERGSISGPPPMMGVPSHQRAKSVAVMEPPVREMPKQPRQPDAMQERILKGDFYMD